MTRTSTKVATRKAAKIVAKSSARRPTGRVTASEAVRVAKAIKANPKLLAMLEASLAAIVPPTRSAAKAAVKGDTKSGNVARRFAVRASQNEHDAAMKAEHDAAVAKHKRMAEEAAKATTPTPRNANGTIKSKKLTAKEIIQNVVNKAIKNGAQPIVAVERKPVKKPTTVEEVAIAKSAAPAKGGKRPVSTKDVSLPGVTKHDPYGKTPETSGPFKTRTDAERHMNKMGWSDCKTYEDSRDFYIKKRDLKPAIAPAAVKTNGALNRPATLESWTVAMVYKAMRQTRVTYMLDDESPRVELTKALADVQLSWSELWDEGYSLVHVYRVAGRTLVMAEYADEDSPTYGFTMAWDATATNLGDYEVEHEESRFDAEQTLAEQVIVLDATLRTNNDL